MRCDVLVVGAGPAGLTTAIALARHDLDVLVVEKHTGTSPFPKATAISTRTMEILRTWGLDGRVRAGAMPVETATAVSATLAGPRLALLGVGYPSDAEALAVSPVTPCQCPQDHLEPVLLQHLRERGGQVRFGSTLTGLRAGSDGVIAAVHGADGRSSQVHARYLVGADGPRSGVREAVGIGVDDLGSLGDHRAVIFHADLASRLPERPCAINAVQHPNAAGLFVPTSTDGRWIYARQVAPGEPEWDCTALLRTATGLPDLAPRITSVLPFTMGGHLARAFRAGPVFLTGDAVHRTTPMGGIGMNTAIQSAHNLGWKLAWVLRGWAGEALLDSYEAERRPVGEEAVRRSLRPDIPADGLAAEIGLRYRSAVVDPDAGTRFPHARVGPGASTIDLFDGRLTVLTGPHGEGWRRAAAELTGPPVVALSPGHELDDASGALTAQLGRSGAVAVRPDGHVAWRHPGRAADPGAELRRAIDRALAVTTRAEGSVGLTAFARQSM